MNDIKIIFLVLLTAHLLVDFFILPLMKVDTGKNSMFLRGILNVIVIFVISQIWILALLGGVSHFILNARGNIKKKLTWKSFLVDHAVKVFALLIISILCREVVSFGSPITIVLCISISGFILTVPASGEFMALKLSGYTLEDTGLKNGGKLIGLLERFLIFIMIMLSMSGSVGLLIAAKSVIRYGEIHNEQKSAEYVLIGTLMSFSFAIFFAAMTRFLLSPHLEVLKELILIK